MAPKGTNIIYKFVYIFCYALCRIFFRLEIAGGIPGRGAYIIAGNHVSYLDPVVLTISCRRKMHFLAKDELFKIPFISFILRSAGTIAVKRGKPEASIIKKTIKHLRDGEIVAIFPQGTRKKAIDLDDHYRGVGLIALKSGAPIIPAIVEGTEKVYKKSFLSLRFPKIKVTFKEPFHIEATGAGKEEQIRISSLTMQKIFEKAGT